MGSQQALPVAQRCFQGLFLFLLPSAVLAPGLEHSCRSHPTPRSRCCAAAARPLPLCCWPFMVSWRFVASHPIATRFLNVFLSLQASRSSFTFGKITSHFLLSSLSPLSLPPSETEEPASSFPPKTLHAGHLPCHPLCALTALWLRLSSCHPTGVPEGGVLPGQRLPSPCSLAPSVPASQSELLAEPGASFPAPSA